MAFLMEHWVGGTPSLLVLIHKAGLKLKSNKSSFGLDEIPYLGYVISRDGIKPDPVKI